MKTKFVAAGMVGLAVLLSGGGPAAQHAGIDEQVALDNESVKVTFLTIPAGAGTGIHLNAEPEIAIVVEGDLTMITRRGKEVFKPGRVVFLPPVTGHDARNEGTRTVKLWALSLKKCE